MKNVTVVYLPNDNNEIKSFHVQHATTKHYKKHSIAMMSI